MLKKLELVGFKSFADKTQFEFGGGVTAIVGPNGSGKSNIVDAVRWILGEQSAKSLRGGEMADVIFNGSGTRRSLGLAEVTMTFDNGRGTLATDAEVVEITRRVYRSGDGEYLINQRPCRLKDIKDLFLGTGAGSETYCIIQQGRIDVLLQASNKDRRTIFEEAAGISRFKAKKQESLRKLERVDQNLARLGDILREIEGQHRKLKHEAAKAERYQEYTARLRDVRVALALEEYHRLAGEIARQQEAFDRLNAGLTGRKAEAETWLAGLKGHEAELARLDALIQDQRDRLSASSGRITAEQARRSAAQNLAEDQERDHLGHSHRAARLRGQLDALEAEAVRVDADLDREDAAGREQLRTLRALEAELTAAAQLKSRLELQLVRDKDDHLAQANACGELQNVLSKITNDLNVKRLMRDRSEHQSKQKLGSLADVDMVLQELTGEERQQQHRLAQSREQLATREADRDRLDAQVEETKQLLADLREQRHGLENRIEVLEGLERRREGMGSGVRELLAVLEQPEAGPWGTVLGMVVDFLTVERDVVTLIDLALGDRAQSFVVRDQAALSAALAGRERPFSSRVTFFPIGEPVPAAANVAPPGVGIGQRPVTNWTEKSGVVARAHELVRCDHPDVGDLSRRLLGNTLVVRDLDTARRLRQEQLTASQPVSRYVTSQGELLDADGTLTVGTHHAESGILSRKNELRELRARLTGLNRCLDDTAADLGRLEGAVAEAQAAIDETRLEIDQFQSQAAALAAEISRHVHKQNDLNKEISDYTEEIEVIEAEIAHLLEDSERITTDLAAARLRVEDLLTAIHAGDTAKFEAEQAHFQRSQDLKDARNTAIRSEERLIGLRNLKRKVHDDLRDRRAEFEAAVRARDEVAARLRDNQLVMLDATATLARSYLEKEAAQREFVGLVADQERHRRERQRLGRLIDAFRDQWESQHGEAARTERELNQLQLQRVNLTDRLRDECQLELEPIYRERTARPEPPDSSVPPDDAGGGNSAAPAVSPAGGFGGLDVEAAAEEIADLKKKIARLGSVNLESLAELAEHELRAGALQTQFDDIAAAKKSLEEIINRINTDSRRLFLEVYTTVRGHFQELFRKLFGGGSADILLEDEADVLETGIEIVARPPGKELRSISLMSGGEKTLTVVALLLSIFRSKPSPFCILDEVDAPLDEANVGRFAAVLKEFSDRSQFIIITHSKRTMSAADVLFGITMQESGVSKRVAVRFEDWPDDEHAPLPESNPRAADADEGPRLAA